MCILCVDGRQTQHLIVVEKLGEPKDSYEKLCASLPPNECRYAVYDFDFTTDEIVKRVKFSSLYGHRTHRGRGSKCCMRVPKTGWCFDASEMSFDIVKERAY
ncbi:hypothetical protein V6N13_074490 [Hibiscus sabdariffa]|uniref:ADF-H domain-containing protein n=1 Tax=Hibiscus sabdariffa TaxID=183260 RepID=A0ABR2U8P3_9ROSI